MPAPVSVSVHVSTILQVAILHHPAGRPTTGLYTSLKDLSHCQTCYKTISIQDKRLLHMTLLYLYLCLTTITLQTEFHISPFPPHKNPEIAIRASCIANQH